MLKLENFKNETVAKALETLAVVFNYKATIVALPRDLYHVVHREQEFQIRGLENLIREIIVAPWDKSHASHDETAGHWGHNGYGVEVWVWDYRDPAHERALRRFISDRNHVRKTEDGYAFRIYGKEWKHFDTKETLEYLRSLDRYDLVQWWGEEPLPEELMVIVTKYANTFAERKVGLPQFWASRLGL
nr:MAG TPA: hypothetical protein [Caudoviricetes sp.]DAQ63544.1 MAG TPA: hypothetical protein [Caudoviricetes sp.]